MTVFSQLGNLHAKILHVQLIYDFKHGKTLISVFSTTLSEMINDNHLLFTKQQSMKLFTFFMN